MKKLLYLLILSSFYNFHIIFAQWEDCNNGIEGYPTYNILLDGDYIYAGTFLYGFFYSNNHGAYWESPGIKDLHTYSLFKKDGNLYVGTDQGCYVISENLNNWTKLKILEPGISVWSFEKKGKLLFVGTDKGLYRSLDDGKTFLPKQLNCCVLSMKYIGDTLFAGLCDGLYISTDDGENWTYSAKGLHAVNVNDIVEYDSKLYLGTSDGVYCSSDCGYIWTKLGSLFDDYFIYAVYVNKKGIYAVTDFKGVLFSSNDGYSWEQKSKGLNTTITYGIIGKNDDLFLATGSGVYKSTDFGENWFLSSDGMLPLKNTGCIASNDSVLVTTVDNGTVYISSNKGKSWEIKEKGYIATYSNYALISENSIYLASMDGMYVSTDYGMTWELRSTGISSSGINPGEVFSIGKKDFYIFAGNDESIYLSKTKGFNWEKKNNGMMNSRINTIFFNGDDVFAGTNTWLYHSTDFGENWIPEKKGLGYEEVHSMAKKDDTLFAGTNNDVYCSFDKGINWQLYRNNSVDSYVSSIIVYRSIVFISTIYDGIYFTHDFSKTWEKLYPDSGYDYITGMTIVDSTLFISTLDGIYKAEINEMGISMPDIPTAPTNFKSEIIPYKIRFTWKASSTPNVTYNIYMSTSSTGPFSTLIASGITVLEYEMLIPTDTKTYYYIVKAYNPAKKTESNISNIVSVTVTSIIENNDNGSITFFPQPPKDRFTISLNEDIPQNSSLEIFDMMGRLVFSITDLKTKEIEINANFFSTGIYYCRIVNGEKVYFAKFQVIK